MCKNNNTPQRPAPRQPPPVQPCPVCLIVRVTEIRGLYQPGVDDRPVASREAGTIQRSGYAAGYTSSDDLGRIFINHVPGTPPLLGNGTWTKNRQFVEITVVVDPPSVPIPAGSKITWSFVDPDDPSNEGPRVHVDAGRVLDPNDYGGSPPAKTGAAINDNDPNGKKQESAGFEQVEARYALSGNDTLIDIPTRTSKVRFNVSDIGGDNWRVKADITPIAPITSVTPATTGIMTAWNKIDVEYVKMDSADELPVNELALHYDMAFVQMDISLKRVVTGGSDMSSMGPDDATARQAINDYASRASGEFSKEGQKGWFFLVAANRMLPAATATLLFENDAQAFGGRIRLPAGTRAFAQTPDIVRVFNSALIVGLTPPLPDDPARYVTFQVQNRVGDDLVLIPHDFHAVDDPDNSFLDADLSHYGFASGSTIRIQVLTKGQGGVVVRGISPGGAVVGGRHFFGGRLLVFTQSMPGPGGGPGAAIRLMCHELCHAFDNSHKCGNWDWIDQANRTSCCMNYWIQFLLDDASPRAPIRWSQNRMSPELCAPHLRHIRDYHLEDNPGLGWGGP